MLKHESARLAGILLLVWLAAYLLIGFDRNRFLSGVAYVSAATVATAIVTFFGVLRLEAKEKSIRISDQRLRSAIAASSVVTYLVLIASAGLFTFTQGAEMPEVSRTLLTSFTATVGVIIAFYFGSSAYVAGKSKSQDSPTA
jgi:hypothetical protein